MQSVHSVNSTGTMMTRSLTSLILCEPISGSVTATRVTSTRQDPLRDITVTWGDAGRRGRANGPPRRPAGPGAPSNRRKPDLLRKVPD